MTIFNNWFKIFILEIQTWLLKLFCSYCVKILCLYLKTDCPQVAFVSVPKNRLPPSSLWKYFCFKIYFIIHKNINCFHYGCDQGGLVLPPVGFFCINEIVKETLELSTISSNSLYSAIANLLSFAPFPISLIF